MEIRSHLQFFLFNCFQLPSENTSFSVNLTISSENGVGWTYMVSMSGPSQEARKKTWKERARHSNSWWRVRQFNFPYSLTEKYILDAFVIKAGLCCNNKWTPSPCFLTATKVCPLFHVVHLWLCCMSSSFQG